MLIADSGVRTPRARCPDAVIVARGGYVGAQLAFEHVALIGLGVALDAIAQIEGLLFQRHLPHDLIEPGFFLAERRVLDGLADRKLEWHRIPAVLLSAELQGQPADPLPAN